MNIFYLKKLKKDPESEIETISESEIIFTEDEKHQLDKLIIDHDTVYH